MSTDSALPRYHRSSFCCGGSCVEVAIASPELYLLRDGKNPEQPALRFDRAEWAAFITDVKADALPV